MTPVSRRARDLPWAKERHWTAQTHLGWHGDLPMVDLHDLSVALAVEVVEVLRGHPPEAGAVVLITGRGKHTAGRSRLRDAVVARGRELEEQGELQLRIIGPGRVELVFDEARARRARPGLGVLFWLFVLLIAAGVLASLRACLP